MSKPKSNGKHCEPWPISEAAKPALHSFCLDDNYGWDDGLICGGRMNILADPLSDPNVAAYFKHLRHIVEEGSGCTEAVVVTDATRRAPLGSRYLFDASDRLLEHLVRGRCADWLCGQLVPLGKRPRPYLEQGVAYLPILPRITLVIVGGGHVGQAVAKLAAEVDFNIWVIDDREAYVSVERFPTAARRLVGDIGQILHELSDTALTPDTFALIATRGHARDEEALYHLAATRAAYVGMIGSKRKIKMIFEDLRARGISDEALAQRPCPAGRGHRLADCRGNRRQHRGGVDRGPQSRRRGRTHQDRHVSSAVQGLSMRVFALLPAGGTSSRMGCPKLALDLCGRTVLERVIDTVRAANVYEILVVLGPGGADLQPCADNAGARTLLLDRQTKDMRATIECGLRWLIGNVQPRDDDALLLLPADHPALSTAPIENLLRAWKAKTADATILVPTYEGRRGHPALDRMAACRRHPRGTRRSRPE